MNKLGLVVIGGLFSLGAFAADEGVTLGGYVDAGYSAFSQDKSDGAKVLDTNGFLVREGAVYLGKKWGTEWEVFSDLAYTNVAGFSLVAVSQAFVAQNMENGLSWKLGQFDGIYGYYAGKADSHAHRLTDKGYIQGAYLPATHTGWMGTYGFSDMLKFSVLVANDNESFGTSGMGGAGSGSNGTRNADFGFLANASFDAFTADVGAYIMTADSNATAAKNELGYVISAVVQGDFKPLNVGVYGVYFKNDAKDEAVLKNGSDFGIGANLGFDMNDQVGFNLRAEYVGMNGDKKSYFNPASGTWTNLTTVTEVKSVMDVTVGGQYKFNDNVKAKLDLSYVNASTTGGTKPDPFYIANAGVVANF